MIYSLSLHAESVPTPSMPMSSLLQTLQSKGYVAVRKIEFDDGIYKVIAINPQGEEMKLKVNPQTGEITKPENVKKVFTMTDIARKLESQGYTNIFRMESDGKSYDVKALDKNGKKFNLTVDAENGEVKKDWF